MIDIAICDDDIILTSVLEKNLTLLSKDKSLDVNIDIFYDGATLLQHVTANSARTVRLFRNRRYIHSDLVVRVFCSKRYVFPLLL